jgi:hypothetical protein
VWIGSKLSGARGSVPPTATGGGAAAAAAEDGFAPFCGRAARRAFGGRKDTGAFMI